MQSIAQASADRDAERLGAINDHLETLEHHARKVADNTGKLREIMELRIWTLYELGNVLNEIAPHGGPRWQGGNLDVTLSKLGISPKLSAKARKVAEIHQEDIRVFIEESGDEINLSYLLRLDTEEKTDPPEWDEDAEWRTVVAVVQDYYYKTENEERAWMCSDFLGRAKDED